MVLSVSFNVHTAVYNFYRASTVIAVSNDYRQLQCSAPCRHPLTTTREDTATSFFLMQSLIMGARRLILLNQCPSSLHGSFLPGGAAHASLQSWHVGCVFFINKVVCRGVVAMVQTGPAAAQELRNDVESLNKE